MMKSKTHPFKNHSKGMVIAAVTGLLAIGTAAFIGMKDTITEIETTQKSPDINSQTASLPDETAEWVPSVPDDTTSTAEVEDKTTETMTTPTETSKPEQSKTNTLTGFVMPIKGEIITPYSDGQMVKSLTLNDWRTHDGIDIAAEAGTPVKAVNSGKVESVEMDPLWGATVVIAHTDGTKSYYMGLNENISVNPKAQVALGDVIGTVGNTAEIEQALPSHLHFAMKKDGNWINPVRDETTGNK